MKRFRFKKIDAFTGPHSPGNPAACVYVDPVEGISDAEMLRLAIQLKGFVSEVAYLFPEGGSYFLRYFSSEREVGFCGHATVASLYDAFTSGRFANIGEARIRVGESLLDVRFDREGESVFIAAPEPRFLPMEICRDDILRALGIEGADLDERYGVSTVNAGLTTLLVPMRRASRLTDVLPDIETLANFCRASALDTVLLFTDDRILPGSDYRTRVFAPLFGYLEDPATGSGNAALGHWLLHHGFWKGGNLVIEQGTSYRDPNIVRLRTFAQGGGQKLLFGGGATVRIEGEYLLQ